MFEPEGLNKRPETYKTLLGERYGLRNTESVKIRMRISKLVARGEVCQTYLRGTRFGESLFYGPEKEYGVLMVKDGRTIRYFYCKGVVRYGRNASVMHGAFELVDNNSRWKRVVKSPIIFHGNVLFSL